MTLIATQVKRRRGTTAENDAFTGAEGEIVVDTERHELRVHDGSTVGGYRIPTKDYGYSKTESDNLLSNKANTALSNLTSAGKKICSNMSMPSNTKQGLTIGASGTSYTAPADGYFDIRLNLNTGGYISVTFSGTSYTELVSAPWQAPALIPVAKGEVITLTYSNRNAQSYEHMNFIYAKGSI